MSWFTGLTDKAEEILTKIDEKAANKLQKKSTKKSYKPVDDAPLTEVACVPSPMQQRRRPSPSPPRASPVRQPTVAKTKSHDEEKLIDFLNDVSKPVIEGKLIKSDVLSERTEDTNHVMAEGGGEKQMLRNEVRVLNNELSLLLHRSKAAEKQSETLKGEVEEAKMFSQNVQSEVERLSQQVAALEAQNAALLQDKLQLEEQSRDNQQVHQLQHRLEMTELECSRLECAARAQQQQTESVSQQLTELQAELDRYRVRAQRTLSDKEALISELRATHATGDAGTSTVDTSLHTELTQLREERRMLSEEVQGTATRLAAAHSRLAELECALEKVRGAAAHSQQDLQHRVAHEANRRQMIEDDYRAQTQELRLAREEWSVERGELCRRVREQESELSQLRGQLVGRPASPPHHLAPADVETRLASLTKTLIHKQTALESAGVERNQLRMQLEELQQKHRELLKLHQTRVLSANDTDDAKAQVPSFMIESPLDTGVARRVKRAYSSLDAVSIRTGVFLRRYPLARILVVLYVVALHMLVLLVLCSRTPDNAQK